MIKGSTLQKNKIFVNIHATNIEVPKYIKQKLTHIKEETDSNIVVRDFNILL